jgi:hypothetical protein
VLKPIDTIKIAQNMEFSKVRLNRQFVNNGKQLLLIFLSKGKNNVSLIMWQSQNRRCISLGSEEKIICKVWTQGQGKYIRVGLSFDDVNSWFF